MVFLVVKCILCWGFTHLAGLISRCLIFCSLRYSNEENKCSHQQRTVLTLYMIFWSVNTKLNYPGLLVLLQLYILRNFVLSIGDCLIAFMFICIGLNLTLPTFIQAPPLAEFHFDDKIAAFMISSIIDDNIWMSELFESSTFLFHWLFHGLWD